MGALSNTYLGIYLEVHHAEETITSTHYIDSIGKTAKSKFNPETGEENEEVTKKETNIVSANLYNLNVDGFSEDEFFGTESYSKIFSTWIPNKNRFRIAEFDEQDEAQNIEILHIDARALKEDFSKYYDVYLKELGKKFKYTVKFGLIHYYH